MQGGETMYRVWVMLRHLFTGMSITTVLAIWGAVLSTITAVITLVTAISKRRSKTPRLNVTSDLGIHQGKDAIFVTAVNRGERPIALKRWSIQTIRSASELKDRLDKPQLRDATFSPSFVISSTSVFPFVLEAGRSCDLTLDAVDIVGKIGTGHWDKLIVGFEDETGMLYTARPMQLKNDRITY
jgi:hypothetical protein